MRDAVSSYESVRTLGEALRAQTHEHGNRMHTAVALIELGRSEEAVELLTETSRVSQDLVDRVLARDGGRKQTSDQGGTEAGDPPDLEGDPAED